MWTSRSPGSGRGQSPNGCAEAPRRIESFTGAGKPRRWRSPARPARSPLAGVGHRFPRLLRRQARPLLQELDRVLVGRAHERHGAVARRAIDGDACFHQPIAERVDVVDLEGEVAKIARLAVVLAVPVVSE